LNCDWCKKEIADHELDELEECLEHLTLECIELKENVNRLNIIMKGYKPK
jgi:hypothetical protein